jgi:L-lactate dehydrogenase (cytochrome)
MTVITCIEDLRLLAKRRVPRMFYDDADSGSWTESTYRANESDFQKIRLRQRVAVKSAITAAASSTAPSPASRRCRRSSPRSARASKCTWTAASARGRTC